MYADTEIEFVPDLVEGHTPAVELQGLISAFKDVVSIYLFSHLLTIYFSIYLAEDHGHSQTPARALSAPTRTWYLSIYLFIF